MDFGVAKYAFDLSCSSLGTRDLRVELGTVVDWVPEQTSLGCTAHTCIMVRGLEKVP